MAGMFQKSLLGISGGSAVHPLRRACTVGEKGFGLLPDFKQLGNKHSGVGSQCVLS